MRLKVKWIKLNDNRFFSDPSLDELSLFTGEIKVICIQETLSEAEYRKYLEDMNDNSPSP